MRAGSLKYRLALQSKRKGIYPRNQMGEERYVWSTYDTVWAGLRTTSGGESANTMANETQATQRVVWEIRYHQAVRPSHRIYYTKQEIAKFTASASTDESTGFRRASSRD